MANNQLHILERFPDKSHLLTYHMAVDPDFYDLCQDYEACVKALRYWSSSSDPNASTRIVEYRAIVSELEQDIVKELVYLSRKQ